MIARLLFSLARAHRDRARIAWHTWRAERLRVAHSRHLTALLGLAAGIDREIERLEGMSS